MTATRTATTLLAIEDIGLEIEGRKILSGVNCKVDELIGDGCVTGQVIALLAPSGVGKTTLLRIIAGLQDPTSGGVYLGKDRAPATPGLVGLVSQDSTIYRNRTVLSNLMVAASMAKDKPGKQEQGRRAREIMATFELSNYADHYSVQLSGGQRQRAAIARQVLCSEHFLLMDEPTAGLDPRAKRAVCNLITKVANQDSLNTVIIVTHDIPAAVAVADTIWLMGRDRDKFGEVIPGARIMKEINLMARGICWQPDIRSMPEYRDTVLEIQDWFDRL